MNKLYIVGHVHELAVVVHCALVSCSLVPGTEEECLVHTDTLPVN